MECILFPPLLAPPNWLTLIIVFTSFFLPIFNFFVCVKLYRLPYWINKINTLIRVPPALSTQIYEMAGRAWENVEFAPTTPLLPSHSALRWSYGNSFSALENNAW